jgi:hypothetical protein
MTVRTLKLGEQYQIPRPLMLDRNGNLRPDVVYTFTSSNPQVASVDHNGIVYPEGNLTSSGHTEIAVSVSVMGQIKSAYVIRVDVQPTVTL